MSEIIEALNSNALPLAKGVLAVSVCVMFFWIGYYFGVRKMKKIFDAALEVFREQTGQNGPDL